ncbi:recombinase family protein [Escherichia coli]|nr:recombinase family protein [Escherichia coli]
MFHTIVSIKNDGHYFCRAGGNRPDGLNEPVTLRERGVNFRSLTDAIDTSTPMGRFFFHVMGALAEMERELIVERTRAGFAAARQEGRNGGRKPKLTVEQWEQAGRLIESGIYQQQAALIYDLGISTVYKKFPVASKP